VVILGNRRSRAVLSTGKTDERRGNGDERDRGSEKLKNRLSHCRRLDAGYAGTGKRGGRGGKRPEEGSGGIQKLIHFRLGLGGKVSMKLLFLVPGRKGPGKCGIL